MNGAPAVTVVLEPIMIEADVAALKRATVQARLAEGGEGDALARAQREYRRHWPDRPVPAALDTLVTELAAVETLPPEAMRTLGTRRLETVRQNLTRAGIDAARLPGTARRSPLVEAAGHPRIEFDLRS